MKPLIGIPVAGELKHLPTVAICCPKSMAKWFLARLFTVNLN